MATKHSVVGNGVGIISNYRILYGSPTGLPLKRGAKILGASYHQTHVHLHVLETTNVEVPNEVRHFYIVESYQQTEGVMNDTFIETVQISDDSFNPYLFIFEKVS